MKRSQEFELRKKCNNIDALCGIKDYLYNDGPSRGLRALDLKNGKNIEMTLLADRGLDISCLTYKGVNIGLNNKVGIRSPYLFQKDGAAGFLKQFNGGLLTTCGITHAGGAGMDGDQDLGLHGPYCNIPAKQVCAKACYEGDDRVLCVSGQVQEAQVFDTDMLLERNIVLETECDKVRIRDVVTNQSFAQQPVMLIYHINFGYPMLDDGAKIYLSATKVTPRDDFAASAKDIYNVMEAPGVGRDEQCYFHTEQPEEGEAFAMLHNEQLGIAAIIRFDKEVLPFMCEWKCMRAGEYALGLEPTTSGVKNRADAREEGLLTYLEPGESREYNVSIEITEDAAVIEHYKAIAHKE
ncbi:MAG: aldose 1-epimerase family protein [Clostridia bacterium]|nr:aldose 1-epimerase family protein [Clostridia bacterium]